MMRRLVAIAVTVLVLVPLPQARAWSNGEDGCDSFGTHDWILKQAIIAVGDAASWVRVGVALRATDDPDCKNGIDYGSSPWWHVWDEWGDTYGGAPEAAEFWFDRVQSRLDAGNRRGASKALGFMAHIVGDIANPMHTDQRDREERIHSSYEQEVDGRIRSYPFRYDGETRADPYDRTIALAHQAHPYYLDLINAYGRHGYTESVSRITKRQLKKGANAVADLITALRYES